MFLQIDMPGLLDELLSKFVSGVPSFLNALAIAVVGWLVSRLVSKALRKFLEKVKIDRIGEKLNDVDVVRKANLDIKLSAIISKMVYYFLFLIFLLVASDVLNMPAISDLIMSIYNLIPNILVAMVILVIGILFGDAVRGIVETACKSLNIPSGKLISMLVFYFIFINVLVSALGQAKINTEFLSQNISLLIGGVVFAFAIGYGLASKDTVANYLASFYSNEKLSVGDVITLDGTHGKIIDIDKTSVTVETEKSKVIFPLNKTIREKIEIHK